MRHVGKFGVKDGWKRGGGTSMEFNLEMSLIYRYYKHLLNPMQDLTSQNVSLSSGRFSGELLEPSHPIYSPL